MDFRALFAHLQGDKRLAFLAFSQANFLHIKLARVDNPARGRHNRISFVSAELASTDCLPSSDVVRGRLVKRFPSIVLGYSITDATDATDPLAPHCQRVTTFTHKFQWPSGSIGRGPGTQKLTAVLQISEWILQMEAEQAVRSRYAA